MSGYLLSHNFHFQLCLSQLPHALLKGNPQCGELERLHLQLSSKLAYYVVLVVLYVGHFLLHRSALLAERVVSQAQLVALVLK